MQVIPPKLKGFAFESIVMDGTVKSLNAVNQEKAKAIMIQFQGADGYFRIDSVTAVTNAAGGGVFSADGDAPTFLDRFSFEDFQAIATSGYLVVQYLA